MCRCWSLFLIALTVSISEQILTLRNKTCRLAKACNTSLSVLMLPVEAAGLQDLQPNSWPRQKEAGQPTTGNGRAKSCGMFACIHRYRNIKCAADSCIMSTLLQLWCNVARALLYCMHVNFNHTLAPKASGAKFARNLDRCVSGSEHLSQHADKQRLASVTHMSNSTLTMFATMLGCRDQT